MQALIDMLTGGVAEFTPQTLVGLVVFVMVVDCIASIVSSVLSAWR